MKKIFKGTPTKVMGDVEDYFSKLSDKDLQKQYQVSIDNTRSLEFNNFFHLMVRELMEFTGEDSIEMMKKNIKLATGYYKDTQVETEDGTFITRSYSKTSEMGNKDLIDFILKVEAWSLHTLNYTFECTQTNRNLLKQPKNS